MDALAKYNVNSIIKNFYYNSSDYGSVDECLQKMEMKGIKISREQIIEIHVSD